jgi:hypothetical protein
MPHYWFLIDPDNPGPRQRARQVRKAARAYGGKVLFIGRTQKNTWFTLVFIEDPTDEDAVYKAVGGRGKIFELEGFQPDKDDEKDDDRDED